MPIPTLIPIPTPIAVANESAGDTQAKNLFRRCIKTIFFNVRPKQRNKFG
jgi:hypothetical protein